MEFIMFDIMLNKINVLFLREVLIYYVVRRVLIYFEDYILNLDVCFFIVVYGDVNYNNWLLLDWDEFYFVDWEGVMIVDLVIDIGMLFYNYVF